VRRVVDLPAMPADRALPDILMPGSGNSPRNWATGHGNNSQTESPISPLDDLDSPLSRAPAPNALSSGTAPSRDGAQQPEGMVGRRQDIGRDRQPDQRDRSATRERSRPNARTNTKSPGNPRICKKCGEPLTGQFVRALGGTYHLECFKCNVSWPHIGSFSSLGL
jgi:hypothetical protein